MSDNEEREKLNAEIDEHIRKHDNAQMKSGGSESDLVRGPCWGMWVAAQN